MRVIGTTFLAGGTRRTRALFRVTFGDGYGRCCLARYPRGYLRMPGEFGPTGGVRRPKHETAWSNDGERRTRAHRTVRAPLEIRSTIAIASSLSCLSLSSAAPAQGLVLPPPITLVAGLHAEVFV